MKDVPRGMDILVDNVLFVQQENTPKEEQVLVHRHVLNVRHQQVHVRNVKLDITCQMETVLHVQQ